MTSEGTDLLRKSRDSLTVNLDVIHPVLTDAIEEGAVDVASSSNDRSTSFKVRFGSFRERSLVVCSFRRWPSYGGRFRSNMGRNDAE